MSIDPATKKNSPALIEWILWSAITTGLVIIYLNIKQRPRFPTAASIPPLLAFVGLLPLSLSSVVRWVILPRIQEPPKRLPLFIAGIALAESCGLLGIFIGGEHNDTLFTLSLLGLAQFFPGMLPRVSSSASSFR